jgi:ATP-dependent RNA helicase DeaD
MKKLKFDELNLSVNMLRAITDLGFEEATPIQSETIPLFMKGFDITGHAQTGTGKTAAFAIPIIEKLDKTQKEIQAIILCPTRELVIQVTEEFRKLLKYSDNILVVPIYGGQEIERQFRLLKNYPQIIVGTPGRMIDHLQRGTIKTGKVKFVVLDEADEMLDMGFRDDIERILTDTPKTRQTVMFSATMPEDILRLMNNYQKQPEMVDVTWQKLNAPKIEQIYFDIQENLKPEALSRLIDLHNIKLALVFCNTKNQVDNLVQIMKSRGYFAEGLHGDMNQNQREKVMREFRKGNVEILVATDVAGRGIDVNDIEAVFNYDLPRDDEDYVHRIGRTGRAGKTGIAFTFLVGKQIYSLKRIEREFNLKVIRKDIPTLSELDEVKFTNITNEVKQVINNGHIGKYINIVKQLLDEDYNSIDIAAALIKLTIDSQNEGLDKSIIDFTETGRKEEKRYKGKKDSGKRKFRDKKSSFKKKKGKNNRNKKSKSYFSDNPGKMKKKKKY